MNIKSIGSKIKGNPTMVEGTVYSMLIICSISHFLNDMIQSIIPSIYPIVKDKFGVSVQTSQLCLFVFLAAFAIGTVAGGMLGDKFGRKYVIWFSILGAAPFAIAMPFVNFTWTIICT